MERLRGDLVRRPRRILIATIVAIAALGVLLPSIAEAAVAVKAPPKSVCLGKKIRVGVRRRLPGKRSFTINILDPSNRKVWSKTGTARSTWRYWKFRPGRLGTFKTVYKRPGRDRTFRTKVVACTTNSILLDDDYGSAMLTLANAGPGDTDDGCMRVTYAGSYAGSYAPTVRLYGSTTGTGLDEFLQLTVLRGKLSGGSASCAGFTPDATDYLGAGPGVIFQGPLNAFPDDYLGGLVDPVEESPETWTNGETHSYRFVISVTDDNDAQGLTSGQRFVWEARAP
jgi:hypothetical protein